MFNHACFTGLLRLVKSLWPLMTEGIAEMMKCNGPRGKGFGWRGLGSEWEEDLRAEGRFEWS